MTYLLILATVVAFVLTEAWLLHRRRRIARQAVGAVRYLAPSPHPPPDAYLHPSHTWVRVHGDGLASIGLTPFASNFAGELSSIELPKEGRSLHQADRACTLTSESRRRLDLMMPIDGKVLAVNPELATHPDLAQRRPYDEGWLLRVRPRHLAESLRNLFPAQAARTWLDAGRALIVQKEEPTLGPVLNDGGELSLAFGERLSDETWHEVRGEIFPTCAPEGS